MSRLTDTILDQRAFARGSQSPMVDVTFGGQMGYAPRVDQLVSNQAYVRRNMIAMLLEAPRFFQLMPDPQKWVDSLKALVELHARSIEGLNAGITLEFDEHPVGGAGEMQSEITDSKRARSEPSFTFVEKYGRPIQTFLQNWIQYGGMDPDTKYALVGTLSGEKPEDLLLDWYSASMLFIEPDPLHRKVMKSWLVVGMMPKSTGAIEGKRDLTTASEVLNLTVEFTGVAQVGLGVDTFAQQILDSINITNANPYLRPSAVQELSGDVQAATESYQKGVEDLATSAVPGAGN